MASPLVGAFKALFSKDVLMPCGSPLVASKVAYSILDI